MAFLRDTSIFTISESRLSLLSESSNNYMLALHPVPYTRHRTAEGCSCSSLSPTTNFSHSRRLRLQPPLLKTGRRLSCKYFPTSVENGRYQGFNSGLHFNHCDKVFISKESRKNLWVFNVWTQSLRKHVLKNNFIGGPTAQRSRASLVASCQPGDGKSYVSSTESLGSSNGHASSSDQFQTSSSDVAMNSSNLGGNMQDDVTESKGDDASGTAEKVEDSLSLEHLRDILQSAVSNLERARLNSSKVEENAQKIAEKALALRDEASDAESKAEKAMAMVDKILEEEAGARELLSKARSLLAEAEQNVLQADKKLAEVRENPRERKKASPAGETHESLKDTPTQDGSLRVSDGVNDIVEALETADDTAKEDSPCMEEQALNAAEEEVKAREVALAQHEKELSRIHNLKLELENEAVRVKAGAKLARDLAVVADEEVAQVMFLAEQAVALELDAAQKVCIAEMALQKAEKVALEVLQEQANQVTSQTVDLGGAGVDGSIKGVTAPSPIFKASPEGLGLDRALTREPVDYREDRDILVSKLELEPKSLVSTSFEASGGSDDTFRKADGSIMEEAEVEKPMVGPQQKKDVAKEPSLTGLPKSFTKRSSRFLPASFFSSNDEEEEFTLTSVFRGMKEHWIKVAVGVLLLCGGSLYVRNRIPSPLPLAERTDFATSFEEVTTSAKPVMRELQKLPRKLQRALEKLPQQEVNGEEASLFDVLWLLLASVIFVPIFQKLPGGSPVLGYLAAGVLIGPYSLSIIRHVHGTKAIAEFGVVFLLFNIGLELSVERLSSMKKYVFGLGTSQVFVTAAVVGLVCHYLFGFSGPAALVVGNGLALSSTAVVLQVLQERGESTSRHGRATFSVLLFQDLAVVVLLILLPLISPTSSKGGIGFQAIAEALGVAALKGVVAIAAIIAGGRLLLRPIYNRMAENHNAEIFAANTLFVVLGTSVLTARAGLSMALGSFLAGLLLAETEFALQVESDIAPYRGLLLGLFFMTIPKFPLKLSFRNLQTRFRVPSVLLQFGSERTRELPSQSPALQTWRPMCRLRIRGHAHGTGGMPRSGAAALVESPTGSAGHSAEVARKRRRLPQCRSVHWRCTAEEIVLLLKYGVLLLATLVFCGQHCMSSTGSRAGDAEPVACTGLLRTLACVAAYDIAAQVMCKVRRQCRQMALCKGGANRVQDIKRIWNLRWDWFHRPIHAVAHILHPLWRKEAQYVNEELHDGWTEYIQKIVGDDVQLMKKLEDELLLYRNGSQWFGSPTASLRETQLEPVSWWEKYGIAAPNLRRIALRVLSQDCSSGPCERNWSTWALFHTKKRNKLSTQQLERLVFCHCNLKLLEQKSCPIEPRQVNPDKIDINKCKEIPDIPQEEQDIYAMLYEETLASAHNTRSQRRASTHTRTPTATNEDDEDFQDSDPASEEDDDEVLEDVVVEEVLADEEDILDDDEEA
ncbi:hypothetical protein L7F22_029120 [Adiantum nelumboides]|nr:hypothetical protein [Adiantum nelumboides]